MMFHLPLPEGKRSTLRCLRALNQEAPTIRVRVVLEDRPPVPGRTGGYPGWLPFVRLASFGSEAPASTGSIRFHR
jgi:hypothetical protein